MYLYIYMHTSLLNSLDSAEGGSITKVTLFIYMIGTPGTDPGNIVISILIMVHCNNYIDYGIL
jgi:hypothetical protein